MTKAARNELVWIQGAGEQASGVAWRLVRAGYPVVAAEIAAPTAVRRLVAFSEAVHAGSVEVAGVTGVLIDDLREIASGRVNVIVDPVGRGIVAAGAWVVVDARMTKRAPVALPHGSAPLIGLGPGFEAGRNADLVIETHREARPGQVIANGAASPYTGIPGDVGGEGARRVLRAPAAGRLEPRKQVGDLVRAGEVVAVVAGQNLVAPFDGRLRGLIHPAEELRPGMKVGDVDPRGCEVDPRRISDKALSIGEGVLAALGSLRLQAADESERGQSSRPAD